MGVYIPGENRNTQGPAPDGFHVPLISEWTTIDGILRYTFGLGLDGDYTTECLKMPYAGQRQNETSDTRFQGSLGYYRCADSSKAYETDEDARPRLYTNVAAKGLSIRPFKNTPVTPDSSRTVLYQGTGSAGVYHNSTLGLISISGDGTTRYTIADKNLGATQVWNSGDTPSEANCGYYYQRGNNYGFPRSGSVTTSSTQVDASNYGPGNYYSSSTFIIGSGRDSSGNGNLWGGVDGNVTTMSELKNAYIGEYQGGIIEDDFSGTTLNSDIRSTENNGGSISVNNGLILSAGSNGCAVYTKATYQGTEKKITAEFTVTSESGSYIECYRGLLYEVGSYELCEIMQYMSSWNNTSRLNIRTGSGWSWNIDQSYGKTNTPYTVKLEIDCTNNTYTSRINGTQEYTGSLVYSLGNFVGCPYFFASAYQQQGKTTTLNSFKLTVES